jgi:hypothetical protein
MERDDLKSMSAELLWSLHQLAATTGTEPATRAEKFREQQQKIARLNKYFDQAVAEIRASLERTHHREGT